VRENNVKKIWAAGGAVVNGWLGIPSSVAAENMAQAGWDSLTVDLQHGLVDYQTAIGMMQAVCTTATMPLCRVQWNEPGIIMKMLDAGALVDLSRKRERGRLFNGSPPSPSSPGRASRS